MFLLIIIRIGIILYKQSRVICMGYVPPGGNANETALFAQNTHKNIIDQMQMQLLIIHLIWSRRYYCINTHEFEYCARAVLYAIDVDLQLNIRIIA